MQLQDEHPSLQLPLLQPVQLLGDLRLSMPWPSSRLNNAAMAPVEPAEALLAGVAKQAITFCADKDGNGVIELKEGCLAVGGAWAQGWG
jgi:hypothetical protein